MAKLTPEKSDNLYELCGQLFDETKNREDVSPTHKNHTLWQEHKAHFRAEALKSIGFAPNFTINKATSDPYEPLDIKADTYGIRLKPINDAADLGDEVRLFAYSPTLDRIEISGGEKTPATIPLATIEAVAAAMQTATEKIAA